MKLSATLLSLALAGTIFVAVPAGAKQDADKKTTTAKKQAKWQGTVVRLNKDKNTIDIRGGAAARSNDTRTIAYNDNTQWTKGGKAGKQDEVKEGSFVIALGTVDSSGALQASRIDLRVTR